METKIPNPTRVLAMFLEAASYLFWTSSWKVALDIQSQIPNRNMYSRAAYLYCVFYGASIRHTEFQMKFCSLVWKLNSDFMNQSLKWSSFSVLKDASLLRLFDLVKCLLGATYAGVFSRECLSLLIFFVSQWIYDICLNISLIVSELFFSGMKMQLIYVRV